MRLLTGFQKYMALWVASRIEGTVPLDFGPFEACGIVDASGQIVAGVVYHGFRRANGTIEMSVAADTPRWATPGIIRGLLAYPFGQLGVTKAVAMVDPDDARTVRFVTGLGFEREAILKRHVAGQDVAIHSMFRETWLKRWNRGQEIRANAA